MSSFELSDESEHLDNVEECMFYLFNLIIELLLYLFMVQIQFPLQIMPLMNELSNWIIQFLRQLVKIV